MSAIYTKNKGLSSNNKIERFRHLIYKISTEFISSQPENIGSKIDKNLKRIGQFWSFDQVMLCSLSNDATRLVLRSAYVARGVSKPKSSVTVDKLPWTMKKISQGSILLMPDLLKDLPKTAELDREHVRREKLKSAIIAPLRTGGSIQGCLFFSSIKEKRQWSEDILTELRYLGQFLAGALERKKAAEQIQGVIEFEKLLSEISATYISLQAADIDQIIHRDLGRLGKFLNVDRCMIFLAGEHKGQFSVMDPYNWWAKEDQEQVMAVRDHVKRDPRFFEKNYQYCFEKWAKGEIVQFSNIEELPDEAEELKQIHLGLGNRSWLSVPIAVGGAIVGALVIATVHYERQWPEDLIPKLKLFGDIFANAIKRKQSEETLQNAFSEIHKLKKQIEADYVYLREELKLEHNFEEIIGRSDVIKRVLFQIEQVAPTDSTVLILGETGTGKELIARALHNASKRKKRPLIKVNCATLTPNLIESELFGHEKGAFTGAGSRRVGRFELADGATLFLDEICELPVELQPKLLRVLQEGEFERVGGSRTLFADVRIIAATNRNIEQEVEKGKFRSDLWYRLNTFPIFVPPLRERREDIALFLNWFVNKYSSKIGKRFEKISQKSVDALTQYSWPGNIRELENIIARAVITSEEGVLRVDAPTSPSVQKMPRKTLDQTERDYIIRVLDETGWKIEGEHGAAVLLGLKPSTLRNRMKKLKIIRPKHPVRGHGQVVLFR